MALYIFLLSIGASFVQRTTGFGFGIFIMTMLPFFLPSYGEATALSGLLAMTTSLPIVFRLRRFICWQRLWMILLTFIVVSAFAIFWLTSIEDRLLYIILGCECIDYQIHCIVECHHEACHVGVGDGDGLALLHLLYPKRDYRTAACHYVAVACAADGGLCVLSQLAAFGCCNLLHKSLGDTHGIDGVCSFVG